MHLLVVFLAHTISFNKVKSTVLIKKLQNIQLVQTEAERRRREAGVKQSMEIRVRSCMHVGMYVCGYGIWNYLANQGT